MHTREQPSPAAVRSILSVLRPGFHTIRLELTDYQPYTGRCRCLKADREVSATLTTVSPGQQPDNGPGQLYVSSTPSEPRVFVDNVFLGITPVSLSNITAGTHTLLLQLQGYSAGRVPAQVTAGQSSAVAASLTALPQTTRAAARRARRHDVVHRGRIPWYF
jgi:hypothetical protein